MNKFSWEKNKPLYIMAPMAGITNSPFRRIVKDMGADIVFSEMMAADALYHGSEKTIDMTKFRSSEKPYIIQLFGNDIKKMSYAAKYIERSIKPDGIDINMGCPAKKVVAGGRGSALLLDFKKAIEVVATVRKATKLPLSVKMRLGWNSFDIQRLVKDLEKAGVDALIIHARTKKQGFSGEPNLKALKEIKEIVSIPIIGNGGIKTVEDTENMLKTGCEGIMVGRGALGNPWIFKSFRGKKDYIPSKEEMYKVALSHTAMNIKEFGEKRGILEMRKHYGWYFKNFEGASILRKKLVQASMEKEVIDILKKYL